MKWLKSEEKKIALILLAIPTVLIATSNQDTVIVNAEQGTEVNNSIIINENAESLSKNISLLEEVNINNMILMINENDGKYILKGKYTPTTSLKIIFSSGTYFEITTDDEGIFELEVKSQIINNNETIQIEIENKSLVYKGIVDLNFENNSEFDEILSQTEEKLIEESTESTDEQDGSDGTIEKNEYQNNKGNSSVMNISNVDGTKYHYVQPKETLYSIASFHGVTVNELQSWNN